jgi:hypothetical protein
MSTCIFCGRAVFAWQDAVLRLVLVEYERTWLCDARGMDHVHERAAA